MPQKHVKNTVNRIFSLPPFFFFFLKKQIMIHVSSVQRVLMESSGGGALPRRPHCVRGAARTFTPPPPSAAATRLEAACVGRGCTGTRAARASSPPSARAVTRAFCGRYELTPREEGSCDAAAHQLVAIVPFSFCGAFGAV